MMKTPRHLAVFQLISNRLAQHLYKPHAVAPPRQREPPSFPPQQAANVDTVLNSSRISYRDALLIQLAYRLTTQEDIDLTVRHPGARTVARNLGQFLDKQHIHAVQDAFQNIGKNNKDLARGNFPEFDAFLRWASPYSGSTEAEVTSAFDYACAAVAATARPVLRMPRLNPGALTFARVSELLCCLLAVPSQGAFEQFTVAALLFSPNGTVGRPRLSSRNEEPQRERQELTYRWRRADLDRKTSCRGL